MPKSFLSPLISSALLFFTSLAPAQQHPVYGSAKPLPDLIVNTSEAPNNAHVMKR